MIWVPQKVQNLRDLGQEITQKVPDEDPKIILEWFRLLNLSKFEDFRLLKRPLRSTSPRSSIRSEMAMLKAVNILEILQRCMEYCSTAVSMFCI